jgi:hypothetical protein
MKGMVGSNSDSHRPAPGRVLHGSHERIFDVLPEGVRANLRHPRSENALLWNVLYPIAQSPINLKSLFELRPLWGTPKIDVSAEERAVAYFWGYSVEGERLPHLDEVLTAVDGAGPKTEVDLFLLSQTHLIVVEVKHNSGLGRCSRYAHARCPEIHHDLAQIEGACRYWEGGPALFSSELRFGAKPTPGSTSPPCNRHYQLARTLMVGRALAARLKRRLHLWMVLPSKRWGEIQPTWLHFVDRVRSDDLWRNMRVLSWEGVKKTASG